MPVGPLLFLKPHPKVFLFHPYHAIVVRLHGRFASYVITHKPKMAGFVVSLIVRMHIN